MEDSPTPYHRRTSTWLYHCDAPDEVFAPTWEEIPEQFREMIDEMNGLRCDGGGVPGPWCEPCCWAQLEDMED